jgi:gamma-glutamylcyclotransferase (GGCT)/AIG2-like uncharacterized protein YtfP
VSASRPAALFVYGTLMPGCDAWRILERWTVGLPRRATIAAALYDTGRGYPCMTLGGNGVVEGVVVDLDLARLSAALEALDAYEAEEYDRVVVRTEGGEDVFTYTWVASLEGCALVAGGRWG